VRAKPAPQQASIQRLILQNGSLSRQGFAGAVPMPARPPGCPGPSRAGAYGPRCRDHRRRPVRAALEGLPGKGLNSVMNGDKRTWWPEPTQSANWRKE